MTDRIPHAIPFCFGLLLITIGSSHLTFAQSPEFTESSSTLAEPIKRMIHTSEAANAFWSIAVRDSTGRMIESYQPDKLIRPASNLKLLTSAAILNRLSPDFTYKTPVYGVGTLKESVWAGDLVIRGVGDPSISGTLYKGDRFHVFQQMFAALDSLGIKVIDGNIIGNESYFDDEPYPKGWSWDDLSFYYGVEISALSFNNNCVDLEVFAEGGVGDTPKIQWFPYDTDFVEFINEQVIAPRDTEYEEYYRRMLGTNTIILRSKLPKGYYETESLSVANPTRYFLDTFSQYLEDSGIEVRGSLGIDQQTQEWSTDQYHKLFEHQSQPVATLIKQINKESDNFFTEMMLKTMAAEVYDTRGSTDLGVRQVKAFADSMGMDTSTVVMSDGSGMSPKTLMSTADLTQFLVKMQHSPLFNTYHSSLSVSGVDGTFKNRFGKSALTGAISGKSGYISGVRAISGYMETNSNNRIIFSIITNHYTSKTKTVDTVQEQILEWLYEHY